MNPENVAALKAKYPTIVNPNLEAVIGVPPHLWRLESGQVVACKDPSQNVSLGARIKFCAYKLSPIFFAALGAAIAVAIQTYL